MSKRSDIEARWGLPFWDLVRDFAEKGLNRAQTARALGYYPQSFHKLLIKNAEHDPFEPYGIVANYVRETGETLRSACERMAAQGSSMTEAALAIGFAQGHCLGTALKLRGIEVKFSPVLSAAGKYLRTHTLAQLAGLTKQEAVERLGFKNYESMRVALRRQGIKVRFSDQREPNGSRPKRKPTGEPHPWRKHYERA